MPTQRPRIQVTLDETTNAMLLEIAARKECSVSAVASNLIMEALELHEDMLSSRLIEKRMKEHKRWISHEDAWS